MSVDVLQEQTEVPQSRVNDHAEKLMDLVLAIHPDSRFRGPIYSADERLWIIDAFFDEGEDFAFQEQLSARETDILLAEGIWLCVILMPLSFYHLPEVECLA